MRTILLLICAGLSAGCDGNGNTSDPAGAAGTISAAPSAASPGRLFAADISRQACEILSPEVMSKVAGVGVAELQQRKVAGMCLYTWDGGQGSLVSLRTNRSADLARQSFENSYRNQTGEEVKDSADAVAAEIGKKSAAGEIDVDPDHAKLLTDAMADTLSGGMQFEDVPGLGDAASFNITRTEAEFGGIKSVSYANNLSVLVGNLHYTVSFALDGEPRPYREENINLARAVYERLP